MNKEDEKIEIIAIIISIKEHIAYFKGLVEIPMRLYSHVFLKFRTKVKEPVSFDYCISHTNTDGNGTLISK